MINELSFISSESPKDAATRSIHDWNYKFPLTGEITRPIKIDNQKVIYEKLSSTYYDGYSQVVYNLSNSYSSQLYINQKYLITLVVKFPIGVACVFDILEEKIYIYEIKEDDGTFIIGSEYIYKNFLPKIWKTYLMSEIGNLEIEEIETQCLIDKIWNYGYTSENQNKESRSAETKQSHP